MKTKKPVIFLTFANDKVDDALYLRNLPLELHHIREALQPAVKAGLCEVVERTAATVDQIFDIFQDPYYQDRIAVFHYGGHASGNQLMFETLDGGHGASHSEGLVSFLGKQKGLQLVFINGCSTQQQSLEMIEAGIPAVVSTATAIKDEVATEISKRFYNGLASGLTIDQSWQQTIDTVRTKTGTKQSKGLKLRRDKSADFPWEMHVREGSEIVEDWNLPMAVNNPLFGLPKLLNKYNLPETPYRFLQRYKEEHAEVFFGRGRYIRDLYNRASDTNTSPVILLYGQSGVGKSSMLDAGVLPRLQQENQVIYVRRDNALGLIGTLRMALGLHPNAEQGIIKQRTEKASEDNLEEQLAPLTAILPTLNGYLKSEVEGVIDRMIARYNVDEVIHEISNTQGNSIIFQKWRALEKIEGKPLIILLDQVEEVFTKANPNLPNELNDFFAEISLIFSNPQFKTKGKLILSYRKEYHPEIDEICKNYQIPREQIFLKQLAKSDIEEVILGLTSAPRLQKRYELDIEQGLPEIIADDLLEDKDSPIAPVLQILLTKMWNLAKVNRKDNDEHHFFTIAGYQKLRKEGILMDDFFYQQMEKLKEIEPELVESGLALDVLNFHTTRLGTANVKTIDDIRRRYEHREEALDGLITQLKNLYLLTDAGIGRTGLAHDTIAPLVQENVRTSDQPGQRALRILSNKVPSFEAFPDDTIIDTEDLQLVEVGANGMRLWTLKEEELIEVSRQHREKRRKRNMFLKLLGMVALIAIIGLAVWASYNAQLAGESEERAKLNEEKALVSADKAEKNLALAKKNEEQALKEKERAEKARKATEGALKRAIKAEKDALDSQKATEEEKQNAIDERKNAEEAAKRAREAEKEAGKQAEEAKKQRKNAEENARIAKEQRDEIETKSLMTLIEKESYYLPEESAILNILNAYDTLLNYYRGNHNAIPTNFYFTLNKVNEIFYNHLGNNIFLKHQNLSRDLELNPTTGRIAFTTFKNDKTGKIYIVYDVKTGSRNRQIINISHDIRNLRFSPDGKIIIANTVNGKILSWFYNPKNRMYEEVDLFDKSYHFNEMIHSISFAKINSISQNYYFLVGTQSSFSVFEVTQEGTALNQLMKEEIQNEYCVFSKTGKYISYITNGSASIYKIKKGKTKGATWTKHIRINIPDATSISFSPNENFCAIGNNRGTIKIYDIQQKKVIFQKTVYDNPVTSIIFSNNQEKLIASRYNSVKSLNISSLVDTKTMEPIEVNRPLIEILGHTDWIYDVTFSQDQKYLYTLSEDKTIRKWPMDMDELYKSIKQGQQKLEEQKAKEKKSN